MTTGTINATQHPIQKIFSDNYIFHIPRYQRPYAWTTRQAGDLLDDLETFIGDEGKISGLSSYFMGSIVLVELGGSEMEVVDGQQRLTTLTILLSVLRSLVSEEVSDYLTTLLYKKGIAAFNTRNRYRLELRRQDASFFQKYIQDKNMLETLRSLDPINLSDSQRNIRLNALLFLDRLSLYEEKYLIRLAGAMITNCFLVVISTSDIGSAYRIFSILNGRGLNLSLTDILKSDILSKIPFKEGYYSDIWEHIEEHLGREKFENLFSYIRMIYRKAKLRDSVLAEINKYVRPTDHPEQFIDDILQPYADAFADIINADYASDSKDEAASINNLLIFLNRIDNADWLPPAILYLARNQNQAAKLLHFFSALECLAAGLMIMRIGVNKRVERYSKLLSAIESDEDLYTNDSPLQLSAEEKDSIYTLLNGDLYLMSEIRQYVLLRLDAELSGGGIFHKRKIITIEHVLPQNPASNSDWLIQFPTKEIREKYVHKLSNLVLLSRRMNSQAQNYDFKIKKQKYFMSPNGVASFPLTVQVLGHDTWTPEVLEQRQEILIERLKKLWNL